MNADGTVSPNFDDERFITSLQWVYDLGNTYDVSPSYATIKAESINRRMALANGQTAMIVDGPYTLYWLQTYMFNDPGDGELPFELGVTAQAYYVPKTSAHPQEAYEFCKFIANEAVAEIDNFMPAYLDHDPSDAADCLLTFTDSNGVLHEDVYPEETVIEAISIPNEMHSSYWNFDPAMTTYNSLMTQVFDEQYSLYLTGEVDMDEFIQLLQQYGAEELANAN
jgi:ABC-type glycerol-3-phosphate transport system substrate-binding protein